MLPRVCLLWHFAGPLIEKTLMMSEELNPNHYLAPELRPYDGRPGAMDAFDLPSLVDGRRVPRKTPILGCVGVVGGVVSGEGQKGRMYG